MKHRKVGSKFRPVAISLLLTSLFLVASGLLAQPPSASRLYQQAFLLEQGRGDLVGAVKLYEQLVALYPDEKVLAAHALLRLGACYELLGEEAAAHAYQSILDDYSDQSKIALEARRNLDRIRRQRGVSAPSDSGFSLREFTVAGSPVFDGQAALSPDGNYLAYVSFESPYPLIVADLSSGEKHTVYKPGISEEAITHRYRWSHDSGRLAFDVSNRHGGSIWIYDLSSRQLGSWVEWTAASHVLLDWGSDSDSIVCLVRDAPEEWNIAIYAPDGALLRQIDPGGLDCGNLRTHPRQELATCSSSEEASDIVVFPLIEPEKSQVVASHSATDRSPIWSPEGRQLAFLSDRDQTGTFDLWAVGLDNGTQVGSPFLLVRDLGDGVRLQNWSHHGRLTFYKENRLRDVWAIPMDHVTAEVAGEAFIATSRQGRNFQPTVSPTGRRIAFLSSDPNNNWTLGVVDTETGKETFTDLDADAIFNPTWRDDSVVVLTAWHNSEGYFLEYDVDLDSAEKVMDTIEYSDVTASDGWRRFPPHPDVSPDGSELLFSFTFDSWTNSSLYRFDGVSLVQLPNSTGFVKPRWSPDGRGIAFINTRSNTLEMADPNLTRRRVVTELAEGASFGTFTWSADGRFLIYPRFREDAIPEGEFWTLWAVSVDGQQQRRLGTPRGLNPWWVDWTAVGHPLVIGSLRGLPSYFVLENFWPETIPR